MYPGVSLHVYPQHSRSFLQEAILCLLAFRRVGAKHVSETLMTGASRQTPAAKRQEYVNAFNKSSQQSHCLLPLLTSHNVS